MHDILAMCVAQCICDQGNGGQHVFQRCTGQHADICTVYELQAVESVVRIVAELEHAHDMSVNQPDAGLPFAMESGRRNAIAGQYFQRDRGARQPIIGQPGFSRAPGSELANQRVTFRKLKSCFQVLH